MVGRLEILQDVTTCYSQLSFGVRVDRLAADVGGEVGEVILGQVSPV